MPLGSRKAAFLLLLLGLLSGTLSLYAGEKKAEPKKGDSASTQDSQDQEQDPLKRPLTEKQKQAGKTEMGKTYKAWLDKDVRWIITDEERSAFKQLSNDEERDQFIEQFWLRRDPTPDTVENEYKEEHYKRIAYANEHFAAGKPGWMTDRGRVYVMYGPPDSIESHPSGGMYQRPMEEGGGTTSTYPFEQWRYRFIEGIGQEVNIEFVDTCMCNDFHMTMDRSEKDALLNVTNAGLTFMEEMGLASKGDRFNNGFEKIGASPFTNHQQLQTREFDALELQAKLSRAPLIKFKDLEQELVTHKIHYNVLPFDLRMDFVKVTESTVLVPVTVQVKNKDITFLTKDGVASGVVNIFGRVTTMTGRIAQTFEDTVKADVPADLLPKAVENSQLYWKALPLKPGQYKLEVVLKDVNGDRVGTWTRGFRVPEFSDEHLTNSSLILADQMEKVPKTNIGAGNFVIGTTKVRPRVGPADGRPASFRRNQQMNLWMQIYNLTVDEKTQKASATIEYDVINTVTNQTVAHSIESTDTMGNVGDQLTLERTLALAALPPGIYQVTVKVNDKLSKQSISPSAKFAVE